MIRVGMYILNERLIKVAMPYFMPPKEGVANPYPPPATKIVFTDNSETIFESMDCNSLFTELDKLNRKE